MLLNNLAFCSDVLMLTFFCHCTTPGMCVHPNEYSNHSCLSISMFILDSDMFVDDFFNEQEYGMSFQLVDLSAFAVFG